MGTVTGRRRPTWPSTRHLIGLVLHLTGSRLRSEHRLTLLGWLWPLVRQLVQLGVLVFLFSRVLKLGVKDYPLFVFTGLLLWNWFSTGLLMAAVSFIAYRHLVFSPRLPNAVLPLVAITVPLVDTLMALPILLVVLAVGGRLHPTVVLLLPLMVLLYAFIAGLGIALATINVYVRDVANVVGVALMLLFYLTPVFYSSHSIPASFHWILDVNPMSAALTAGRAVVLDGTAPRALDVAVLGAGAVGAVLLGWFVFSRLNRDLIDQL
jgi:lipopolysaccharide transport system permease protein